MTTRIKLRRDTAANWTTTNPILAAGEPGLETDTGKIKYGDGVSRWNVIEHTGGDTLINDSAITVRTGDADRWFVRLRREDNTVDPEYTGVVVNSTNYDSEGNAIVVATLGLSDAGVAVFKFTSAGDLVWKKALESIDSTWWIESNVVVDTDDNIIFAVNPDAGIVKMIVKLNGETGAVIFSEVLVYNESYNIKAIAVDSNSNIIIGGNFWFPANNNETAFVAKLNSTATTITWQHSFVTESNYSYIKTLEVDFNDDIIVAGYVNLDYQIDGNTEQRDTMLLAKITSAGTVGWQKKIALDDVDDGRVTGISLDSLGNIYATGTYQVDNPSDNSNPAFGFSGRKSNAVVIFKMTTLGSMVWDRRVGPGQCDWVGVSTAVGEDGDLYLYASTYQIKPSGNVSSDNGYWNATLALARYNKATGAVIWQSYFDNPMSQDVPAWGNDAPWNSETTDLMTVKGNKILIGGSVRLGASDMDLNAPWNSPSKYFNQGFLAQFDTDATTWSAEGWTLSTSRIPGKLTNTLAADDSALVWQTDIDLGNDGTANLETLAVGVSVRRTASKVNTWTFGKDGTFSAPEDANIKLNQKQLGYATLYGLWQNNESGIWFESVTHDADGFAYVLGSDNWNDGKAHIYKFTPDGNKVWATQLHSGSGASFNIEWADDVYTTATVNAGGSGYKVGDKIVLRGSNLGGNDGVNSLTLTVATINEDADNIGAVATVTIVGGVAIGTSTASGISDQYDDADCEVRSIAFDPVTGNPVVLISTPTYNGDTLDPEWTQTVTLLIDSGSGAVLSTTTLADEGDIYANDIAVSSTGVPAVVGEKYNEYNEYGTITPLVGSGVDKFWVSKADIDTEHFPGETNGGWVGEWWITGTGITDQARVQAVNEYTGLTTEVRQGSGAEFTVEVSGGTYSVIVTQGGSNYVVGHQILVLGSNLGGTTPENNCIITVDSVSSGLVVSNTGTPNVAAVGPYTAVPHSNLTGSGAVVNMSFNPVNGSYVGWGSSSSGQYYVIGDRITISGTQFAGGTSPANDITFNVTNVDGSNGIIDIDTPQGSIPSTHLLLSTGLGVDFAPGENTFSIKQSLGSEAFIWTPSFTKAIGGNNSDWFSGVVWNTDSSSLYAVGSGRYDVDYDQALVVKYSSTGTLQASVFVNDAMGNLNATKGAVALMAGNSIVVVHQQYNNYRDQTDEILVTKLDSDLNIVWQQFIGVDSENDGWYSPEGRIGVAVDPATDEIVIAWSASDYSDVIGDDAIHIIKLDTDGEVLWKRIFGIHESDSYVSYEGAGNKFLSIKGDKFTIVGYTEGPANLSNNAWIATLPLDGTGVGLHGVWTYAETTDNKIKVWRLSGRTSSTFTPNVHSGAITNTFNAKYYYTDYPDEEFTFYPEVIRSNQGGAVEFADGSKQTFSTSLVPQVRIGEGRYTIRAEDSGRHILIEEQNYNIIIPNWQSVTLPVGFTFTIVNISGATVNVENEDANSMGQMWFSGGNDKTPVVGIDDNGSGQMVTLLKIKEGTYSDDGEQHGDIWMIAGADISNND